MFTRGFSYVNLVNPYTTLINMDPGQINTKMPQSGWSEPGIEVGAAAVTYNLATS